MPNKYEKYYRILDLDVGTSKENVKKAFRELSHIWHPDNHMGKSSNVQNRATEKFKEITNAYQVLKEHLSTEDKKGNEQDQRKREGEERKQREENERRKREEESKRRNEQDRKEREEKENKYWEEQAKKKHEEEKSKQKNKEHIFVGCPECETKIITNTAENNWRVCTCCGHLYHYFFEDGKLKVVRDSNQNFPAKTVKVPSKDSDFRWGRVLLGVVFGFVLMFLFLVLFSSVKEGIRLWKPLAEQGDTTAQSNLGVMYDKGKGVPHDYKEAARLYRLSAEQGNAKEQLFLGVMYYKGRGVPQDYQEAVKWYRLSAEQGNTEAQLNLGLMYDFGQGVPQDYVSAHMWFNLCGSSGDKDCVSSIRHIEKMMSPSQIEKAQEMARNWKPTKK